MSATTIKTIFPLCGFTFPIEYHVKNDPSNLTTWNLYKYIESDPVDLLEVVLRAHYHKEIMKMIRDDWQARVYETDQAAAAILDDDIPF